MTQDRADAHPFATAIQWMMIWDAIDDGPMIYFAGLGALAGLLRGSSASGRQTQVIDELLFVKMTVFFSNLESLNCFHKSSLSFMLASHFA